MSNILYSDQLVTISETEITFPHYYLFGERSKRVRLAGIEQVLVLPPTFWNGKWRLHGSGSFTTWFPRDYQRYKRDRIFRIKLKTQRVEIGFTAEDGARVEQILQARGLLRRDGASHT